jgi:CubicO group peptidase (beta-lactamase class C family)
VSKDAVKSYLCLICVFVAALRAPVACAQDPAAVSEGLEQTAVQEMKRTGTPGVAIAVVKDDRIVFSKAFGFANLETQVPMTPDTLCRSGPITAVFTATALLLLQEQGKLMLDQPVGRYVSGLSPKLAAVNARQLLSHAAGLKEEHQTSGLLDDLALGRTVRSWKDDYSLSPPGEIYSHSNPGYALAGLLLEEVSKEPFANVLSKLVFEPLGMSRTTFRPSVVMNYPFAQSYRAFGREKLAPVKPFALDAFGWPGGSMFSSVNDLARFAIAFLNGGKIEGKQVYSRSLIDALSTPVIGVPGLNDQKSTYGFLAEEHRGVRVLSVTGSWAGFTEQMWIVPEHRFALIVMANRNMGYFNATAEKAMEMMLPLGPAPPRTVTQALPMSDEEMSSYLGTYSNEDSVELVLKDHRLFLRERGSEMPVTKLQEHVFAAGSPSPQAQVFTLLSDASGRIEFLHRFGRALKKIPASQTRNQ